MSAHRVAQSVHDSSPEISAADMVKFLHGLADDEEGAAVCYFMGGDDGPIKIGYSVNVKSRLQSIQNASPTRLRVLATSSGGIFRERAYHIHFAAHRLKGEWFERTPEIQAEIDRLSRNPPGEQ
jgi:hypothetical protein